MSTIDLVKAALEFAKKVNNLDLQKQLIGIQEDLLQKQNENQILREENAELRKKLSIEDNLIFENNVYWLDKEDGRNGPYCPDCYHTKRGLKPLHVKASHYRCGICGNKQKIITSKEEDA